MRLNGLANNIGMLGMAVAVIVLLVLVIKFCIDKKYEDGAGESASLIIGYFMVAVTIVVVAVPEGKSSIQFTLDKIGSTNRRGPGAILTFSILTINVWVCLSVCLFACCLLAGVFLSL